MEKGKPFQCAPVKGCFTVPAEGVQEYIECEGIFRVPHALLAHVIKYLLSFLSTAQPATASGIDTAFVTSPQKKANAKQSGIMHIAALLLGHPTVLIYSAGLIMKTFSSVSSGG